MASVPGWAHLRHAENPEKSCSTCDYFEAGRCSMFDFAKVDADETCDKWEGNMTFSAAPNNRGKTPEQNLLEHPSPVVQKFDPIIVGKASLVKEDGSGPTSSSVHIDAPLPNISISYATVGKKLKRVKPKKVEDEETVEPMLAVKKADTVKQIVYGVVLEPHVLDTQSDYMLPNHVEKAAHTYLKKVVRGNATVSKLQHRKVAMFKNKPSVVPVESYIAPCDFTYEGSTDVVKKGSWVLAVHVEDPETWQEVLDGKWSGFSVGGLGVRQELGEEYLREGMQWMGASQPSAWSPQPPYTG